MRLIDGDAIIIDLLDRGIEGVQTDDYAEFRQIVEDAPTVDAVPVCVLKEILMRYFDIGDSYHFELTRAKEAFEVGTMGLDDFQEWTEENVDDLVDYIKKNCAGGERKGGDE